jgi:hypothetical protein
VRKFERAKATSPRNFKKTRSRLRFCSLRCAPDLESTGAELRDNLSMQLLRPYRIALAIFVLHPGPLTAQDLVDFVRIQEGSAVASGNKIPVIADIELRTEVDTLWGTLTQTLTGKFWRSRDGKSRQDDAYGNSLLFTASTQTWLDHEAKSAISEVGRGSMFAFPVGVGPASGPHFVGEQLGKKTIGGRIAIGFSN